MKGSYGMCRSIGFILLGLVLGSSLVACRVTHTDTLAPTEQSRAQTTLRLLTHDSFSISESVLQAFEQQNQVHLEVLKSGDAGTATQQALLNQAQPLADVFYGVDNTLLSKALAADLFVPYTGGGLETVPDALRLDQQNRAVPIDYGDVCLNYSRAYFETHQLPVPTSLADLTKPAYKNLLVVENPLSSSPGLAFLLATIAEFGNDGYLQYWQDLQQNGVKVAPDWSSAYYTEFSQYGGAYPLVVSYASSPAAEVLFADPPVETSPTGALTAAGMCFRQIEFAGVLRGSKNETLAQAWIEFMLSDTFQADIPLQMFVYPSQPHVALPDVFIANTMPVIQPATLDAATIVAKRDGWLQAWDALFLR